MKSVVVAPQPRAVEAGVEMYKKGGNAIDAAAATAFTQDVIDPTNTSLGGMGVMSVYYAKTGEETMISFHGQAPLAATPTMFEPLPERFTGPLSAGTWLVKDYANQLGYKCITVPGETMALCQALEKYGTLSLKEVLLPAIRFANEGWRVTAEQQQSWLRPTPGGRLDILTRFMATPAAAKLYTKNGKLLDIGDLVINKDLGNTLSKIAQGRANVFYRGEIAKTIAQDFSQHGGLITGKDLTEYKTVIESPLRTTYRGYSVSSAPPVASGVVVLQMLNIVEGFELGKMEPSSAEYVHLLAETMRIAFGDMSKYLGDQAFVKIPLDKLLSKDYAEECRQRINPKKRMGLQKVEEPPVGGETTQVTTVDHMGNAVSLTHTLGAASGVVTPGLGFMYNGAMHRFNPYPGYANSIAPGKSRITGMSPTMVFKDGKLCLVLGAPGGQSIILGVFQTILNVIDHKLSMLEAVSVPRFHCEQNAITLEARYPSWVREELGKMGHLVEHSLRSYDSLLSGNVHGVLIDHAADKVYGAADPRAGGVALYF